MCSPRVPRLLPVRGHLPSQASLLHMALQGLEKEEEYNEHSANKAGRRSPFVHRPLLQISDSGGCSPRSFSLPVWHCTPHKALHQGALPVCSSETQGLQEGGQHDDHLADRAAAVAFPAAPIAWTGFRARGMGPAGGHTAFTHRPLQQQLGNAASLTGLPPPPSTPRPLITTSTWRTGAVNATATSMGALRFHDSILISREHIFSGTRSPRDFRRED